LQLLLSEQRISPIRHNAALVHNQTPFAKKPTLHRSMTDNPNLQSTRPKRILVVEDEPCVAEIMQAILIRMGHEVEIVTNAKEALGVFQVGKYDLVATDFHMPGMDGLELARSIKALCKTQRIILITGSFTEPKLQRGHLEAVDVILQKPFALEELADAVAKALGLI